MAPSVSFRRGTAPVLGLVLLAFGGLPVPALGQGKVLPQEVWCLEPPNMERVVRTAELLGLGTAGGNRRKVVLSGATSAVALATWRQQDATSFRSACDRAYSSEHPDQVSEREVDTLRDAIEDLDDGPSDEVKFLLALAAGIGAAGAGAYGTYQFGKKQRDEEIAYANALLLGNELILLMSELEVLAEHASAGAVTEADRLAVVRQTARLMGRIPARGRLKDGAKVEIAFKSLRELQDELARPADADFDVDAARLRTAKDRIGTDVGALVAELSQKAADAMSLSKTADVGTPPPDAAASTP